METIFLLDLAGTVIFAYTGAVAAKQQRFHLLGVFYIAALTAVGGGTVRHLLLQTPGLFWLESSAYLSVIAITCLLSYVPLLNINTRSFAFYILDALALAVFISIGVEMSIAQNLPSHFAFTMGILTGIGGGLIRDAITGQRPQALSDPAYPLMILAGATGSLLAIRFGYPSWALSCLLVSIVAVIAGVFFRLRYHHNQRIQVDLNEDSYRYRFIGRSDLLEVDEVGAEYLDALPHLPDRNAEPTPLNHPKLRYSILRGASVVGIIIVAAYFLVIHDNTSPYFPVPVQASIETEAERSDSDAGELAMTAMDQQLGGDKVGVETPVTVTDSSDVSPERAANVAGQLSVERDDQAHQRELFLRATSQAERALENDDLNGAEAALDLALEYGGKDSRIHELRLAIQQQRSQVSQKMQKTLTKTQFELQLQNIRTQLDLGNLAAALDAIDIAKSFKIADTRLSKMIDDAVDLTAAQSYLSDDEIAAAQTRLESLVRAIELMNLKVISQLTNGDIQREQLFSGLFERYTQIEAQLTDVKEVKDSKRLTATLRLKNMRLPNGNIAYPPDSYGVIPVSLDRTEQGWSRILW